MGISQRKKLGIVPSSAVLMEHGQKLAYDVQRAMEKPRMPLADPDYAAEGFEPQKIAANRGPTYEFWGKLLGEYSTQSPSRPKARWTELRLWGTPSGKWIAESVGCTSEVGQVSIVDAIVIPGTLFTFARQTLAEFVEGMKPETRSMEFQAMDFWEWTSPAKALAKRLGWDLTVTVE